MNESLIIEIWNLIREYGDKKQMTAIANKFVDLLMENGVRESDIESALGTDDDLDDAIKELLDITEEDNFDDD
jgi:hypothetical protein